MTTLPSAGPTSTNIYVDALQWGGWHWDDAAAAPGQPTVISYYLDTFQGIAWTAAERSAIAAAFETWSAVANITFVEVFSIGEAQLVERLVGDASLPGALGVHGTPDTAANGPEYDGSLLLGANNQAYGYYNYQAFSPGGLNRGGYDFLTFVHELGHGLGLAHPHDDGGGSSVFPGVPLYNDASFGSNRLNQGVYTVMSYNDGWAAVQDPAGRGYTRYGFEAGPMAFDIAAIQDLYGANTTTNSGNNVYVLPGAFAAGTAWTSIWDTGGTDEIVYNGLLSARIDLRAATIDNSPAGGGILSFAQGVNGGASIPGGFTIAKGVVIENATGGQSGDILTGNSSANVLSGGGGNDRLHGLGGGDTFAGDAGTDTVSYAYSAFAVIADLMKGTGFAGPDSDAFSSIENLDGSAFNDVLTGNDGVNVLSGGGGSDTIEGGGAADRLNGGSGADTVSYEHALAGVRVNLSLTIAQNTVAAGRDTIIGFENISGSAFSDVLVGSRGANSIDGGAGNDVLTGGLGLDTLTGGLGQDAFTFASLLRRGNVDTITDFEVGIDRMLLNDYQFFTAGPRGFLANFRFTIGTGAADRSDRIIYDDTTGNLIFDENGSRAGGARVFAHLDPGLALTASDFYIF